MIFYHLYCADFEVSVSSKLFPWWFSFSADLSLLISVSKDDMENLRQALRTLSEAEKQLRTSNDKLTWLTAALLQLAPDQQYLVPSSSTETSFNHSPLVLRNSNGRDTSMRDTSAHPQMSNNDRTLLASSRVENRNAGSSTHVIDDDNFERNIHLVGGKNHAGVAPKITDIVRAGSDPVSGKQHKEIEKIWFAVLEKIRSNSLKQFMHQEGKLVSVSFGSGISRIIIKTRLIIIMGSC